ncbi:MAG: hypothetical protein QXX12_02340 [Nanopusillaceae archaeon]
MNKVYFATNVIRYIPTSYLELARAWGIRDIIWGPILAFVVSFLLITGIVWLGLMLSFGKLARENELIKKSFILIVGAISFIATYGAAEFIVSVLSNLIYLVTMFVAVILLFAVGRALWAGVPAAGATIYEAKKQEEEARRKYEEERYARMLALKRTIDELSSSLETTEKILDDIINILSNLPGGIQTYGSYIGRLRELKQKINDSKGKPSAMYATLSEAIHILEEILEIPEFSDKIKDYLKKVIDRIRKVIEIERGK